MLCPSSTCSDRVAAPSEGTTDIHVEIAIFLSLLIIVSTNRSNLKRLINYALTFDFILCCFVVRIVSEKGKLYAQTVSTMV